LAFSEDFFPQVPFRDELALHVGGGDVALKHMAPARSDADGTICFRKANVIVNLNRPQNQAHSAGIDTRCQECSNAARKLELPRETGQQL
jgi:hypothetical protein